MPWWVQSKSPWPSWEGANPPGLLVSFGWGRDGTCDWHPLQKQQALLGQMLLEGYGCEADPVAAKEWIDKARRRGYRMSRVYCEI